MTEVFADAFYYIALLNPADQFHAAAVQATQKLNCRLVTTLWILMEVTDALCAPSVLRCFDLPPRRRELVGGGDALGQTWKP